MCNMNTGLNLVISPHCFHYQYLPKADLLSAIVPLTPSHPSLCVPALVCLCEWLLWPDPFRALVYRSLQRGEYLSSLPLRESQSFFYFFTLSFSLHSLFYWVDAPLLTFAFFQSHSTLSSYHCSVCMPEMFVCMQVFECVFPYVLETAVCTFRSECRCLQAFSPFLKHYRIPLMQSICYKQELSS